MLGNEATTDALGFVQASKKDTEQEVGLQHLFTRITPEFRTGTVKNSSKIELKAASNCWICEGWSEFIFDFEPPM